MEYDGVEMKKKYYVRYYQTNDKTQTLQQFLQAIASVGQLRLHSMFQREIERRDYSFFEYTTIWEIDFTVDYLLLEDKIDKVLASKEFNGEN